MATMAKQDIRFCKTVDGVTIAYSTMGQGLPLVIPPQFVTHLEADLVEGPFAEVYEALAQQCMVVRFDKRGTGLSEREISALSSDEDFIPDLEAVVDELRLQIRLVWIWARRKADSPLLCEASRSCESPDFLRYEPKNVR